MGILRYIVHAAANTLYVIEKNKMASFFVSLFPSGRSASKELSDVLQ